MAYQVGLQEETVRKGPWLEEEDKRLATFVALMGERRWDSIARVSGLQRSGKSCRLRWLNYLRPDLKRGRMTAEEEHIILQLQEEWGNKWSKIARRLPGRTDNEIKNYWRTHLRKKLQVQKHEMLQGERTNEGSRSWSTQKTSFEVDGHVNDTSKESIDAFEMLSASPYEASLFEWMSNNQNSPKHQGQYCILDSSSCSSRWHSGGDADNIMLNSGSLWDI